jgi:hypothetical protein
MNQLSPQRIRRRFSKLLSSDPVRALARMEHNGKIILNSDDLFLILPEYATLPSSRPILGPLLYATARKFIDQTYRKLLSRPVQKDNTVVFTAGGSASGKSTILRSAGSKSGVDFLVDTTFSDARRAFSQVNLALDSRRKVAIYYVYADFRQSVRWMIRRALNPNSGRLVPIDDMARTHFGAQRAILGALQKYQGNKNVIILLRANAGPNSLVALTEAQFERRLHNSIDVLRRTGQAVLDGFYKSKGGKRKGRRKNQNPGRKSVRLSHALYEAARSKTQKTKPTSRKGDARRTSKGA